MFDIINLFKKYTFLRLYTNLGKIEYTDDEKKCFIKTLQEIAIFFSPKEKLKYEICGAGYGISKGQDLIGEKSFNNKLLKKGYTNLTGIWISNKSRSIHFEFSFYSFRPNNYFTEFVFNWKGNYKLELESILFITKIINKISNIEYGNAYPNTKNATSGDAYKHFFHGASTSGKYFTWIQDIYKIKNGDIFKIYPYNILNKMQAQKFNYVKTKSKFQINNNTELWSMV